MSHKKIGVTLFLGLFAALAFFAFQHPFFTGYQALNTRPLCTEYAEETITIPCVAAGAEDYVTEILVGNYNCQDHCDLDYTKPTQLACGNSIVLECDSLTEQQNFIGLCAQNYLLYC